MAKTLHDLISSGALAPGTRLCHSFHGRKMQAVVVKGGIEFRGNVYTTPSAAAKTVTDKPVQGWEFWRLPDGRSLNALRLG